MEGHEELEAEYQALKKKLVAVEVSYIFALCAFKYRACSQELTHRMPKTYAVDAQFNSFFFESFFDGDECSRSKFMQASLLDPDVMANWNLVPVRSPNRASPRRPEIKRKLNFAASVIPPKSTASCNYRHKRHVQTSSGLMDQF